MQVEEAILAHSRVKNKLSQYYDHPDGSIDVGTINADDKCDLGHWLRGDGAKYASLEEFEALHKAHAHFHHAAADVAKTIDTNRPSDPDELFGTKSELAKSSAAVTIAIQALAKKIA